MFALTCYVYAQWSYIVYDYNNTDCMTVSGVVYDYNNTDSISVSDVGNGLKDS